MAAKKTTKKAAKKSPPSSRGKQPPTGYTDHTMPDIDGWLRPEEGTVVHGKIVGTFTIAKPDRPPRDIIMLKLFKDIEDGAAVMGGEEIELGMGDVVALTVVWDLREALSYAEHHGELWAHYVEKKDIGGGQSKWVIQLACKGKKSAPPERQVRRSGPPSGDDDDIPF